MVRVAFVHPDLGIGGAERLVVDAAVALRACGHGVHVYTAHHDAAHCFAETRDGTVPVTVYGDWLPRSLFGAAYALCAYLRMIYVALAVVLLAGPVDVVVCDQVSACIPVLRLARCKARLRTHAHGGGPRAPHVVLPRPASPRPGRSCSTATSPTSGSRSAGRS